MRQRGFSLIELLAVVTILGMLAAFVAPKYFSRIAFSQREIARAQIDNLDKALIQYRLDTEHYPDAVQGLAALRSQPSGENRWRGPYLKKPLTVDPWGNAYVYETLSTRDGAGYQLLSYGRDGRPGGSGYDADINGQD